MMSEQKMRQALKSWLTAEGYDMEGFHAKTAIMGLEYALAQREAQEPVAWLTEDGQRCITARTMSSARKDGGAILSSLSSYTVPVYASPPPAHVPSEWVEFAQLVISTHEEGGWPSAVVALAKNLLAKQERK